MRGKLTPKQIDHARQLRAAGLTWKAIGIRLGCGKTTAHRSTDPTYARKRQDRINLLRNLDQEQDRAAPKISRQPEIHVEAREALQADRAARLAEIPRDNRNLTARIAGDPISGDRRRHWCPWLSHGSRP